MGNKGNEQQVQSIRSYYQFQSKIYDLTRWSFLFGRQAIVEDLPVATGDAFHLLEIGCGTGWNTKLLAQRYPNASLTGMDVSSDMLTLARARLATNERVRFLERPYQKEYYSWTGKLDAILFSYSLTMINPQWQDLLEQAKTDLKPGGLIAVVDFHHSDHKWFRNHMSGHHVRMEKHLLPVLSSLFKVEKAEVCAAYFGLWEYFKFIGRTE